MLLHVTDNYLKILYLLSPSKNMKPRHSFPKRQKFGLILSTFTLCYLEMPLLIYLLHREGFQSRNSLARFRPELRVPVPHIPWVLHAIPAHLHSPHPAIPNCNSLACIQGIFCESLKNEFWRFHGSEWSDFPNVKDTVIEITLYVIDPCLTPSIITSFLFFLATMCGLIMGFKRHVFEVQHKNSFFFYHYVSIDHGSYSSFVTENDSSFMQPE